MATPLTWLALDGIRKSDGTAAAGGKLRAYLPNTTTQAVLYADADETAILSQPVTLDGAGRTTAFVSSIVKLVVTDSTGAAIATIDRATAVHAGTVEVQSPAFTGANGTVGGKVGVKTVLDRSLASLGGTDFKFKADAGATERTVSIAMVERGLSVKDKGAKGDNLTVDTAAFNTAIATLQARSPSGGVLIIPPGTYLVDALLTAIAFNGLIVEGAGSNATVIKSTSATAGLFSVSSGKSFTIRDVQLTASAANSGTAIVAGGSTNVIERVGINSFKVGVQFSGTAFHGILETSTIATSPDATGIAVQVASGASLIRLRNVYMSGVGIGVQWEGTSQDITIQGCQFSGTMATGLKAKTDISGAGVRVLGSDFTGCTAAINISPVTPYAAGFYEYGNTFGSATITDTSYGAVYGSFSGGRQGNTITAAANNILAGGTAFTVNTSATAMDRILGTGWQDADRVLLLFAGGNVTVNHATATSGANKTILLAGAANKTFNANDSLELLYSGGIWYEIGRTEI